MTINGVRRKLGKLAAGLLLATGLGLLTPTRALADVWCCCTGMEDGDVCCCFNDELCSFAYCAADENQSSS